MKLVLIRHAEAIRGPAATYDEGLTPAGTRQVAALAKHLASREELVGCASFHCSPLRRAVETASLLSSELALPDFNVDVALSEIGEMPGSEERESLLDGFTRVRSVMNAFAERYEGEVVMAVSHAGFIMSSIRVIFDIPTPGTGARLDPGYTSCTEWSFRRGTWRLEHYNVLPGTLNDR